MDNSNQQSNSNWVGKLLDNGIGYSMIRDVGGTISNSVAENLELALRKLNLLSDTEYIISYEDEIEWKLGGAETYIAIGHLRVETEELLNSRRFIAKAVVTFPTKPEDSLSQWLKRFDLLSFLGVACPHIYSAHKAVLYQEFLDSTLEDAWETANLGERIYLSCQIVRIAAVLDACGFHTVGYLQDLRMRSDTICIVDVGEDIGPWNFSRPVDVALSQWSSSIYAISNSLISFEAEYQETFSQTRKLINQDLD
jgi:hypothetical protein